MVPRVSSSSCINSWAQMFSYFWSVVTQTKSDISTLRASPVTITPTVTHLNQETSLEEEPGVGFIPHLIFVSALLEGHSACQADLSQQSSKSLQSFCRAVSRKLSAELNEEPVCLTQESCGMGLSLSLCHQNHLQNENCSFSQETPRIYIHFGINWAHPSIEEEGIRESRGGFAICRWAMLWDIARTKMGAGRSFIPANLANGKATLLFQPILAFQNQLGDSKKKGQRNNYPFPSRAIFDADRKPHSFSFFKSCH